MGTLKPQSDGPLYSNTVIGSLAVDGWAVTFGTARKGRPRPVPSSLYQMQQPTHQQLVYYQLEICMGMGFPMGTGIPWDWESHGNGNKTQNWEWEWEGMGNHLSGNGNYLHSHGNVGLFPKVLCCNELIKLLVL